jgi:hypothetical protein
VSGEVLALTHFVIVLAVLIALAIEERRGRKSFRNRHGTRYRRISTAEVLEMIRKATERP